MVGVSPPPPTWLKDRWRFYKVDVPQDYYNGRQHTADGEAELVLWPLYQSWRGPGVNHHERQILLTEAGLKEAAEDQILRLMLHTLEDLDV